MPLEFTPQELFSVAVQAVILGILLGMLYHVLKVLRVTAIVPIKLLGNKALPSEKAENNQTKKFVSGLPLFFSDLFFSLVTSVSMILLSFVGNDGQIRWFLPLGILLGFLLYRHTLMVWIDPLLERFVLWLRTVIFSLLWGITLPLRVTFRWTRRMIHTAVGALLCHLQVKRDLNRTKKAKNTLLTAAEHGFLLSFEEKTFNSNQNNLSA